MKVDIWSDVACPFCYIGKRRFEKALAGFANADAVAVTWHSFELNPALPAVMEGSIAEYLATLKGMSLSAVEQMMARTTAMAEGDGLTLRFDRSRVSNTRRAHELLHYARVAEKQRVVAERLFAAYFAEGANVADVETLVALGSEAGLNANEVRAALEQRTYEPAVMADEREASALGISGVPFFVFNEKYAVSGAQGVEVFADALEQVWEEEQAISGEPA